MLTLGLASKFVVHTPIQADANLFFELLVYKTSLLADISPQLVQSVELHEGQWGKPGSIVQWNYTLGGQKKIVKQVIESVDDVKKSITCKVIEGDLLEKYKSLRITASVEASGIINLFKMTFEYEKKALDVSDPQALGELCLAVGKDINRHFLLVPN